MRLLLVEDDQLLGQSMETSLSRCGYTVDWLQNGAGVLSALKMESFSCIILDLTLPDIDGLEVLAQLRKAKFQLPVLILTARDDIDDRVKGLDAGADDYLVKPFALEELMARLRVLIRRQSGYSDPLVSIGDLTLSMTEQSVTYQGEVVRLTHHEFKLLSSLVMQAGRVQSKEQLQQVLYGWDEGAGENAIEVHIHNLRKKLNGFPIKNIRGVGYLIEKSPQ
ncbi:response regulator [Celerinatantimonas sp. YJH-8]|uniref:response regulator n=1 Tax=Celerinatantimonas sp. YJH-8 TaxID=3228714 RepID=UPI0038C3333A